MKNKRVAATKEVTTDVTVITREVADAPVATDTPVDKKRKRKPEDHVTFTANGLVIFTWHDDDEITIQFDPEHVHSYGLDADGQGVEKEYPSFMTLEASLTVDQALNLMSDLALSIERRYKTRSVTVQQN